MALQSQKPAAEQLEGALSTVLSLFEARLGLSRETVLAESVSSAPECGVEAASRVVIEEMCAEPDDEAILATRIKNQNKDQKAQQSFEDNMDAQGFGSTFTSGFYNTATSGFGGSMRPQSAFMNKMSIDGASMGGNSANPNLTEAGDDDEEERRAQMEFEQSMRATSMSFFKTAKSTFMSTNDLQSDQVLTESFPAWGVS